MMQNSDLIAEELQRAGASADSFSPLLLRLDGYRITTESDLSEEAFLMSIKGKPCFPRRDLSAVTGQAKSGKTVLVSLLMASAASAEQQELLPGIKRLGTEPLKVMWVDTEQSPQSTLQILKGRVAKMISGDFPQEAQRSSMSRAMETARPFSLFFTVRSVYRCKDTIKRF